MYSMHLNSVPNEHSVNSASQPGERRKNPRFDMHFPIVLRALGDSWITAETADVSATGTFFVSQRPFLLNAPIEYVLSFPPELTKASQLLLVRFFGMVVRCERVQDGNGLFGIAVRNTAHRYLTREEAANFGALDQKLTLSANCADARQPRT
jgi:PilZ domain-containing protein